MTDRGEELLQLSGLQHFSFCRRQWALIHVEGQWAENVRTVDGTLFHARAHDGAVRERRGDRLIIRGLSVYSHTLGLSGTCDVVEFARCDEGITLRGESGGWAPFPVEYKRGRPKPHQADEIQLCAQAMCLEEMLCCKIPAGALFYGEPHQRTPVEFDGTLRQAVRTACTEMHALFRRGQTPRVKPGKACGACSLKALCLPKLLRMQSPSDYLQAHLGEETP